MGMGGGITGSITIKGLEEYANKMAKLDDGNKRIIEDAVYAGANVVADKVRDNLEAAFAVDDKYNLHAYKTGGKYRLSKTQKRGLLESFGVTKVQDKNGFYHVKGGFDGYNEVKTEKYPNGQPNQLIAGVVESGSTYMKKQPFIRPAVNATKKLARKKMQEVFDKKAEKIGL